MFPLRSTLALGAVVGLAALGVLGGTPSYAAPAPVAHAAAPDPAATHRGSVPGAVRGAAARAQLRDAAAGFRAAHRDLLPGTAAPRLAPQIHPAQGTSFTNVSGTNGAVATQSYSSTLTVAQPSTTIYTPTMYPAGGSCIEVTTVYRSGQREVAAWDWCKAITFTVGVPINAAFTSTYGNGGGFYSVEIARTNAADNTWTAYLYNYATATWQTLASSSGTTQAGTSGWDVNELYSDIDSGTSNSYACADMAGVAFEARSIQQWINGSWIAAAPGNAGQGYDSGHDSFRCPAMTYEMINQYDHWRVVG